MVEGEATPLSNSGTIAIALPYATLIAVLDAAGYGSTAVQTLIQSSLDLDLDGDGKKDAMSAAFTFDSVPAKKGID